MTENLPVHARSTGISSSSLSLATLWIRHRYYPCTFQHAPSTAISLSRQLFDYPRGGMEGTCNRDNTFFRALDNALATHNTHVSRGAFLFFFFFLVLPFNPSPLFRVCKSWTMNLAEFLISVDNLYLPCTPLSSFVDTWRMVKRVV